jgi:hypothetical protein
MEFLDQLYQNFLNYFPPFWHPFISIALAVFFVYSVFQVLKRNFIFLIVLVVLLPASIPILQSVLEVMVSILKRLLGGS